MGTPPQVRINGVLEPLGAEPLTADAVRRLALSLLNERQIAELAAAKQCDLSIGIEGL